MFETEKKDNKKLVKNASPVSYEIPVLPGHLTNKPIRRITMPYIRVHKVKNKPYYTYCRGIDKEIYLGNADYILEAVKEKRRK